MRIHFPLLGFNLSGGIRVVIRLANGLRERGHEVRITAPSFRSTIPFPLDPRVEVEVIRRSGTAAYLGWLARNGAGWGDVVVATGHKTPLPLHFSRKWTGSPARLLYLIQGYEPVTHIDMTGRAGLVRWGLRAAAAHGYSVADKRVYVSRFVAEQVGLDAQPVLVHPGVDASIFHPPDRSRSDHVRVGVIASGSRGKGWAVFREAWEMLTVEEQRLCSLVIAEPGDERLDAPEGAQRVRCEGDAEVAAFYQSVDVFVFPSLFEGFGLPPLEAMACGCAVISSDCGGVREFAADEANALVAPPGDAASLGQAISRLIGNMPLRDSLGRAGVETARRFTWEATVAAFEEAATTMLDQP